METTLENLNIEHLKDKPKEYVMEFIRNSLKFDGEFISQLKHTNMVEL